MANASFKDILNVLLMEGAEGLSRLTASRRSFRLAMKTLRDAKNPNAAVLEAWCKEHHKFGFNNKGRASPKAGSTRVYKSMDHKGRRVTGRIPLSVLGDPEKFTVSFEEDVITLRAKP